MVEWVAMSALVVVLLLIAAHYLRKSLRILRQTTPAFEMLPDERLYLRQQAWRRLSLLRSKVRAPLCWSASMRLATLSTPAAGAGSAI